jgi:hypothetical protein
MRVWLVGALVISVGCGDDGGSVKQKDAGFVDMGPPLDAAIDAKPIDAMIDTPPVPANHTHFVIDRELLPQNNTQARDYGLDLNGDLTVDNQLGMIIATLAGQGLDSQVTMDRAIDTGVAITLADLAAVDLMTASSAAFTFYKGANPTPAPCSSPQDTICRKHLAGTGSFTIDASAPKDTPLFGSITAGKLTAGPGHLTVQFTMTGSMPIMITLLGARVELTPISATAFAGKIGGAISMTDINTKVMPALRDSFQAQVMAQCTMLASPPTCGCPQGSSAKTLLGLFDTNPQDCNISLTEVQNNSLILSLFAPDVTVENTMGLSLGIGVHAVTGAFADPM